MKFRFVLLVVLCSNISQAQDTVYFRKDPAIKNTLTKKGKGSSERHVVKIAPLAFISGFVPVFYEKSINDLFSIQVGAGITTRNYLRSSIYASEIFNPGKYEYTYKDPALNGVESYIDIYDFTNRRATLGSYFSVQPRVYFGEDGLDGTYLGIGVERYNYRFNSLTLDAAEAQNANAVFTGNVFKEKENITDFNVVFGTQYLYSRISLDYAVTLGLRKQEGTYYAYTFNNTNSSYTDGQTKLTRTFPNAGINIRVGYHF